MLGTRSTGTKFRILPKGPVWRRHIEQLKPRYVFNHFDEDKEPGEVPSSHAKEQVQPLNMPDNDEEPVSPRVSEGIPEQLESPKSDNSTEPSLVRIKRRNPLWPSDTSYGPDNPRRSERLKAKL